MIILVLGGQDEQAAPSLQRTILYLLDGQDQMLMTAYVRENDVGAHSVCCDYQYE